MSLDAEQPHPPAGPLVGTSGHKGHPPSPRDSSAVPPDLSALNFTPELTPRLALASRGGNDAFKSAERRRPPDDSELAVVVPARAVNPSSFDPPVTPTEMVRYLDRFVIGSQMAKEALAIAAYNHQRRIRHSPGYDMVERTLSDHFSEGKSHSEDKVHALTGAITAALRANPISNRRDSRARRDVCELLKVYEEQQILALTSDKQGAAQRGKPQKRSAAKGPSPRGKSNGRLKDNPSGKYAAVIAAFVKHRTSSDRQLKNRSNTLTTSRETPLIIGQSGSGKSMLVRYLAEKLKLPFAHMDASQLTEAGWQGEDVSGIAPRLLKSAEKLFPASSKREKVRLASHGVVFLDEVDKKAGIGEQKGEISREGAQGNLLIALDGYVDPETGVDLGSALFILGGSFSGAALKGAFQRDPSKMLIAEIVERRIGQNRFGFEGGRSQAKALSLAELLARVDQKDLIEFGIIPELAGRVQPVATEPMTAELLAQILEDSKESPLRTKVDQLLHEGLRVRVTEDGRRAIAAYVVKQGLGARPLRLVVNKLLHQETLKAPDLDPEAPKEVRIDAEEVASRLAALGLIPGPTQP